MHRVAFPAADLRTHVAVVGAAGSGKTWMAKVLAEEAIRNRIPVLAIDPQGDLVQFLSRRPETEIPPELIEHYREFWERVEPRIFTPGTSHGLRLSLDPIRVASPDDLARIADPQERDEQQTAILSSVASNLVSLASIGGETQAQATFVFQLLGLMSGKPAIGLREIVAAIQEPEPLGIDQPDYTIRKAERQKLARALNAYVSGPASNLFVGGERLDLDRMITPSDTGRVPLNVVYLNALTDDGQKQFFVGALAAEIYRWMVTSLEANGTRPNLLFYLDEARDYIPAGTVEATGQGPAHPPLHPGPQVRRRLPPVHPEPPLRQLQRLRQLQHQAHRPPRSHARRRARHRMVRHNGRLAPLDRRPQGCHQGQLRGPLARHAHSVGGPRAPQPRPLLRPRRRLVSRAREAGRR